eukprot:TRINITY_DN21429_c0_g2_i2.p1 TRINITY_DN21429_c0_g2~~TRINITY_DN21429_c0_g2_i2.p1  ORF type:complete len:953 (+),score=194.01 TRINITY_DN21429_c0_g2_i2:102-2960(+)
MQVIQKVGSVVSDLISYVSDEVLSSHTFRVYISNASGVQLVLADHPSGESFHRSFGVGVPPGEAGVLRFCHAADVNGSVEFRIGETEKVVIRVHKPLIGKASVTVRFASGRGPSQAGRMSLGGLRCPHTFASSGNGKYAAFVHSVDKRGTQVSAHILIGRGAEDLSLEHGRVVFRGDAALQGLDTVALLNFARYCCALRTIDRPTLASVLYMVEVNASLRGLHSMRLPDQAFVVNLLVRAFLLSGLLDGVVDASVLANHEQERAALQPASLEGEWFTDYSRYRRLEETVDLAGYVETTVVLLKSAELRCSALLWPTVQKWTSDADVRNSRYLEPSTPSSTRHVERLDSNSKLIMLHMTSREDFGRIDSGVGKIVSQTDSSQLVPLVRHCVHRAAICTKRLTEVHARLEELLPGDERGEGAKAALRHYRSWVPAARRGFRLDSRLTGQALSLKRRGGVSCCACAGSNKSLRKKSSADFGERMSISLEEDENEADADSEDEEAGVGRSAEWCCEFYGAELFSNLDGGFAVSPDQLLESLGCDSPPCRTMSTNSKSGEFFCFSHDRYYIVKTISADEATLLLRMLPAYHYHLRERPRSLLVRYAGLFCIDIEGSSRLWFSVMTSVFDPLFDIHDIYDVKGSTFKRKKKAKETIGKDEDFVAGNRRLHLSEADAAELCAAHEQDAVLLQAFGVMDYSLLIGIHDVAQDVFSGKGDVDRSSLKACTYKAVDEKLYYFVGLIDFLISYGHKKEGEHIIRVIQGHGDSASCVDPLSYARRQVSFIRDRVVEELNRPAEPPSLEEWMKLCSTDKSCLSKEPSRRWRGGTLGILWVTVLRASGLRAADWGLTSDPYAAVVMGLQRQTTPVVRKNLEPEWNCTMRFAVDEGHLDGQLEISVWDHDFAALQGEDDFLGIVQLPLSTVLSSKGPYEVNEELRHVKCGRIMLRCFFVPRKMVYSL